MVLVIATLLTGWLVEIYCTVVSQSVAVTTTTSVTE